jgi:GT2 family glycosyltransferase/glycosyltransferase involved in cell wall biosynthesis
MEPVVDVIIPVYRGFEVTRRCIESVLAYEQRTAHQVVVIDDASPEPELRAYLDALAEEPRIELLRNSVNQGFVCSANAGMRLHPERDVVLLNSDTEVANDWLDRLRACACNNEPVATVTPFSNNATICSYPRIGQVNALPAGSDVASLDALFRDCNAGIQLDLFTGVGFCLYLTRAGIDALGGFDEYSFGTGYGEEVDYCMRGRTAGWRNLLCADCFVYHHGAVSFQTDSEPKKIAAQRVIDRRFPDYRALVEGFFERDPPRPLRRAVDLARLRASPLPRLLFVCHVWGGGVARHVDELAEMLSDAAEVLLMQPLPERGAALRWLRRGEEFALYLPLHEDPGDWIELLSGLGLARVHYHHVQGFPEWILDLASSLGLDYDVTLHDYMPVCPQMHFIDAEGRYCGEPDVPTCTRCIAERPAQWQLGIEAWRQRFLDWLAGAARVIAPSQDVAGRMRHYRPDLEMLVWPHAEPEAGKPFQLASRSLARRKVVLLGSVSDAKGLRLISACARHAAEHGVALDFRVIGSVREVVPTWPQANLSIYGEYAEGELPAILERERPDAFLFSSVIPETYSYTLTLAKRTGLPIVALAIGAVIERLRDYAAAEFLPTDIAVAELVERLAALPSAYAVSSLNAAAKTAEPEQRPEAYSARYLAPVRAAASPPATTIEARCYFAPRPSGQAPSLEILYEHGILCGMAEARAQFVKDVYAAAERLQDQERLLEQRARDLAESRRELEQSRRALDHKDRDLAERAKGLSIREGQIAELNRTLQNFEHAHRRHVEHLDTKIAGLERRTQELEGSTFWKMTKPLRWLVHTGKQTTAVLRSAPADLPRGVGVARRLLAEEGLDGLAREVRRRAGGAQTAGRPSATASVYQAEAEIKPLVLPVSQQPLISIIIPTFGQHSLSYTCLASIAKHAPKAAIEVLLVDDAAPEPAADALGAIQGLRIIRNDQNLGFLRTCNAAAKQAQGRYLLFLNNDTIVLEGCVDALVSTFEAHQNVGAVGAKLLFPDGRLQEAGGIVWRDASAWNWGRNDDPEDPRYQYLREVDYCSAACLMVPSDVFAALSGFDERYTPAYYEDTDLCFGIRESGKRVLYQPAAAVVHFEGATHGTDEGAGLKAHQVRNRRVFKEKWALRLSSHLDNGVCPERERDRVDGKRVLWIEACMLTPDQDSGSLRTWRLLGILCELGCKVTFMADNLESSQPYTRQLQQQGIEVQYTRLYVLSVS